MKNQLFNEQNFPYICTPLTGKNTEEIMRELTNILPKNPDLIEWRVDFYKEINDFNQVLVTAEKIAAQSSGLPLLFTIRSHKEGGESIPLSEEERVELLSQVCQSEFVDIIDIELSSEPEHIKHVREVSEKYGKKLILSYHNFECTPEKADLRKRLSMMESYGADIAKAAVMPKNQKDVLTLLEVTSKAKEELNIPLITMSMGDVGSLSRMLGWFYGSAVTFAVGEKSSAPGQIPIEDLRKVIELIKKPMGY
ncbi:type I 3-dehydroquinate dehydratase [Bacillus taeanensis]|uniref:3-dehydroquinate dehydratase n=1 Tax=Bacillus taeanensis TaxID=273032 RepID=A0A366XYP2_9BACI|nr:type I 3-dehydroquinate dehydratase [Bacillus taeanensis]RBW70688.1 type I 3-dehydroquinate dehydratase [Bacillus taeanensis]